MGPAVQQIGYLGDVSQSPTSAQPYIRILEQPAPKETRFRYKCEGRSAGSIPGASSTPDNKTHPKIQIMNFRGKAVVVVSCVTKNSPFKAHPHNLVGKDCKKGVCTVEVTSDDMSISFPNLGIQCVKRKDIEEALNEREQIRVDPFRTGFHHKSQPSNIDLNSVRLCFQAFLEEPIKKKLIPLQAVVSEPVHDKKAVQELTICKLSHCSGSAGGGTEMILLCEKVVKEDIAVRFFEEKNGQMIWESYADFPPSHVHKQVAISFRTPKYATLQIEQPVSVQIELRRPSDGATSEPRQFTIYPVESDRILERKRKKTNHPIYDEAYNPSQDDSYRGMHNDIMVKREPIEGVSSVSSLAPGLYAGGSVSGAGVASLSAFSRSPSPNYSVNSPLGQQLAPMSQSITTMTQMSASARQISSYNRPTTTPPAPPYQQVQNTYTVANSPFGDFNMGGPSTSTYTNLDNQETLVAQSNITQMTVVQSNVNDTMELNTEELRRMVIEEATQNNSLTCSFTANDISI